MATADLQNSYGPEIAPNGHDLPQAVAVSDGLEAAHGGGQQHALAPPYGEQHAKNNLNQYSPEPYPAGADGAGRKRRVLGLPVVAFWGVVIGLVLILAIGLGVGLGVGLSQRDSSGGGAATATAAAGSSVSADPVTSASSSSTPTSSGASSSTATSSTSSATSAVATARNVEICNQASLAAGCTNLTVPVNTCVGFPSGYNNSVSSVDTGGPECDFYTGNTCSGQSWSARGTNYLIPGQFNDKFNSVACFFSSS